MSTNKVKKNGSTSSEVSKIQPTAEQIQLAQLINNRHADNERQSQVKQIMELTCKSQEAVVIALHDHVDPNVAIEFLLEDKDSETKWEVSAKKKKRQPPTPATVAPTVVPDKAPETNGAASTSTNGPETRPTETEEKKPAPTNDRSGKDQPFRRRGGSALRSRGPPRLNHRGGGANNSRNWRQKESEKNIRNLEDHGPQNGALATGAGNPTPTNSNGSQPPLPHQGDGVRPFGGPKSNRGGNRGNGGGGDRNAGEGRYRGGNRGRGRSRGRSRTFQNRSIGGNPFPPAIETWNQNEKDCNTLNVGNWSEFVANEDLSEEDWSGNLSETKVFTPSSNAAQQNMDLSSLLKKNQTSSPNSLSTQNSLATVEESNQETISSTTANQFAFSEYAQQATANIKAAIGMPMSVATSVNKPAVVSSVSRMAAPLPQRQAKKNPSRIPESPVEMPGSLLPSIEIQFGALQFGTDDNILTDKPATPSTTTSPQQEIKPTKETEPQITYSRSPSKSSQSVENFSPKPVPNPAYNIHQVPKSSNYNPHHSVYNQTPATTYNTINSNSYSTNNLLPTPSSTPSNNTLLVETEPTQQLSAKHSFDPSTSSTAVSASPSGYPNVSNSYSSGPSSNLGTSSTSTSTTSAIKTSLSATGKTNVPAACPPMISTQYLLGQHGLSFYGIPPNLYSIEDMQMVSSRMPAMSYYDMQYPTAPGGPGREVAYTGSEGRYARTDTDTISTSLAVQPNSNQTQTFMNAPPTPLPPGYTYYYPSNMMASYQPMFPVPSAVNSAHGNAGTNQFTKPGGYGSYTPGYDALSQAGTDYTKSSYGSASQGKSTTSLSGAGGDLSIYNKGTHPQLAKNFDKSGFHTGTPPPFPLTGPQGVSSTGYPPAAGAPYISVLHPQPNLLHHPSLQSQQDAGSRAGQNKGHSGNKNYYWGNN